MIRINKYLASCGVASRRSADELILQGRVRINGKVVDTPGVMVDEIADSVTLNDEPVMPEGSRQYILLNKPTDIITTLDDPFDRPTVKKFVLDVKARVYPVGRLDRNTAGVLLMTNDGELAHRLTHPRYGVKKIYEAVVKGHMRSDEARRIRRGVRLEDGVVGKAEVKVVRADSLQSTVLLTLAEGRKREVRQMCQSVGHPVVSLTRVEFAGLTADGVREGNWRRLSVEEVERLRVLVGLDK